VDYILKNIDGNLWKDVKKLAIDKDKTVKDLILDLLFKEVNINKVEKKW